MWGHNMAEMGLFQQERVGVISFFPPFLFQVEELKQKLAQQEKQGRAQQQKAKVSC